MRRDRTNRLHCAPCDDPSSPYWEPTFPRTAADPYAAEAIVITPAEVLVITPAEAMVITLAKTFPSCAYQLASKSLKCVYACSATDSNGLLWNVFAPLSAIN